ncbi:MAG: hypothetical protein WA433_05250, partial [Desulfobaccales bacterium]
MSDGQPGWAAPGSGWCAVAGLPGLDRRLEDAGRFELHVLAFRKNSSLPGGLKGMRALVGRASVPAN